MWRCGRPHRHNIPNGARRHLGSTGAGLLRGSPVCIRSDNGPEFIAKAIREWLDVSSVDTLYVAPGSPWENGYAEAFHSVYATSF